MARPGLLSVLRGIMGGVVGVSKREKNKGERILLFCCPVMARVRGRDIVIREQEGPEGRCLQGLVPTVYRVHGGDSINTREDRYFLEHHSWWKKLRATFNLSHAL